MGDDRFAELSPLRRVPVLIDDRGTLCDSSVICQYLGDRHPEPALYPRTSRIAPVRAGSRFADTRMGDVFVWRYFNQLVIRRFVWGEGPTTSSCGGRSPRTSRRCWTTWRRRARGRLRVRAVLDRGRRGGVVFRNAAFARFTIDAALAANGRVDRARARVAAVRRAEPFEGLHAGDADPTRRARRSRRSAHRSSAKTYGTATPRRRVMSI